MFRLDKTVLQVGPCRKENRSYKMKTRHFLCAAETDVRRVINSNRPRFERGAIAPKSLSNSQSSFVNFAIKTRFNRVSDLKP